jgi:hypothetical protein
MDPGSVSRFENRFSVEPDEPPALSADDLRQGGRGFHDGGSFGVANLRPRDTESDLLVDENGRATLRAVDPFKIG